MFVTGVGEIDTEVDIIIILYAFFFLCNVYTNWMLSVIEVLPITAQLLGSCSAQIVLQSAFILTPPPSSTPPQLGCLHCSETYGK